MKAIIKKMKNIFHDMDKPLLIVTILLFVFGLLNIVTASSREAVVRYDAPLFYYFMQQSKMLILGLIATVFILNIPTKAYRPFAFAGFIVIFFICIYLLLTGDELKGALNWVEIAGFRFQPSEFSKPIIIVCLALLFEQFQYRLRVKNTNHYDMIGLILFIGLAIPAIVFLQKDFGTMFIIFAVFAVLFLASPILRLDKLKTVSFLTVTGLIGILLVVNMKGSILSEAQMARFDFINPCANYTGGGYQVCNGFIAINDGSLLGLGIGKSKQKYSYIPEPHTDSVFAIVAEEYGLIKCILIFMAYAFLLKRILNLSSRASTMRGKYICLGVATYIFMHILVNLGGLFGVLPLTGVPLPFLSYGGSFTVSLVVSLAIVQRIHVETNRQKITV